MPECENLNNRTESEYMPSWIKKAIPFISESELWKCRRYKPLSNATFVNDTTCTAVFSESEIEDCHDWVFATEEVTLVREVSGVIAKKIKRKNCAVFSTYIFLHH